MIFFFLKNEVENLNLEPIWLFTKLSEFLMNKWVVYKMFYKNVNENF